VAAKDGEAWVVEQFAKSRVIAGGTPDRRQETEGSELIHPALLTTVVGFGSGRLADGRRICGDTASRWRPYRARDLLLRAPPPSAGGR